jgi:hypothetical protein
VIGSRTGRGATRCQPRLQSSRSPPSPRHKKPHALGARGSPTWFHPSLRPSSPRGLPHTLEAVTGLAEVPYSRADGAITERFEEPTPGGFSQRSGQRDFQPMIPSLCGFPELVLVPVNALRSRLQAIIARSRWLSTWHATRVFEAVRAWTLFMCRTLLRAEPSSRGRSVETKTLHWMPLDPSHRLGTGVGCEHSMGCRPSTAGRLDSLRVPVPWDICPPSSSVLESLV